MGGVTSRPYRVTDPLEVLDGPLGRASEDRLRCPDAAGVGAYLEAADAGSARLYARRGYQPTGPGPAHLPGGPPVRPMWRPPAGHISGGR